MREKENKLCPKASLFQSHQSANTYAVTGLGGGFGAQLAHQALAVGRAPERSQGGLGLYTTGFRTGLIIQSLSVAAAAIRTGERESEA